ncbi:MAG TPA: hypothetical protein QGH10_00355 [Armatimonadota bacterium]|nr:hypothetical protein [Armatimonadota bacterium]
MRKTKGVSLLSRRGREFWGRKGPAAKAFGWLDALMFSGEVGCAILEWPLLIPILLVVGVVGLFAALVKGSRKA